MNYMPGSTGFRTISSVDGVAVLTAPKMLVTTEKRSTILVTNPSPASDVFLKFAKSDATAPTITTANRHYPVYTQDMSSFLGISESISVWSYASSSTFVNVVEMGY